MKTTDNEGYKVKILNKIFKTTYFCSPPRFLRQKLCLSTSQEREEG